MQALAAARTTGEVGRVERSLPPSRAWLVHVPLAVAIVAYALRFSLLSVNVHDGYGTPPFDMGIFDQGLWLLSRFHSPFVTIMGRNLFGDHTSFILLLLVPLYWVYPHPQALLVVQSWLLALAAIPIYLLGLRRLGPLLATLLACAYLLNPALQNGNLEQFHPECFLVLTLAVALYAAVEWRPALLVVAVVLSLLVKEDTALLIVPLGAWVAWRRNRRWGLWIMAAGVAYMLFATQVAIATILGTASFYANRIPFGGVGGVAQTAFAHPVRFWNYVKSGGRLFYLWQMGIAVGFGFAMFPEVAAIGILTFGENVLSTFPYMHQILYHYSMPLVPVLVAGTVLAIARLATRQRQVIATVFVTVCAFVSCVLWGLAPFSRESYAYQSSNSPEVHDINTVLRALPSQAVVSAYYPYVSHIDHRLRIYLWPTPFRAQYWGLYTQEGQRLPFASQIQYLALPTDLTGSDRAVFASIAKEFHVVAHAGDVALYRRN